MDYTPFSQCFIPTVQTNIMPSLCFIICWIPTLHLVSPEMVTVPVINNLINACGDVDCPSMNQLLCTLYFLNHIFLLLPLQLFSVGHTGGFSYTVLLQLFGCKSTEEQPLFIWAEIKMFSWHHISAFESLLVRHCTQSQLVYWFIFHLPIHNQLKPNTSYFLRIPICSY